MKLMLVLLVLLPLVYCASLEERFIFDSDTIKNTLISLLGSDATEATCETACGTIAGIAATFVCPSACTAALAEIASLAG